MFAKPYKLKSTNSLKNSEKKILVQRIVDSFPAAKEEQVKELVPAKAPASCLKLVLHSGETVAVYASSGVPVLIETEAGLVPTLCALWKLPDLVPTITIHTAVLGKILGGAPLYLPGVEIPYHGVGFPMFAQNTVIAACTTENKAAGVVGRAAICSADMLMRAAGVCLETIHVFGDQLCKEPKFAKIERPKFGNTLPATDSTEELASSVSELAIQSSEQKQAQEQWPALGRSRSAPCALPPPPAPACAAPPLHAVAEDSSNEVLEQSVDLESGEEEEALPGDMDGLLRWALLTLLRLDGARLDLPLKTNLLYRNHLIPLCPEERTLDVKKSTYKKMSKFLEAMQREGLLEVKEIEKGVDAVVNVSTAHPLVRSHRVPAAVREMRAQPDDGDKDQTDYSPPQVREMLCVTAAVTELFPQHKKGTALTAAEVRAALTEHVRARSLAAAGRGAVLLDAPLARVLAKQPQECVKWDALMAGVCARMTAATELRWPDGARRLVKARLEPVAMQVASRSGNKRVTLVNNLEAYGFNLVALSSACQRAVGASCGVTRSPGARADQLMLQGDQTHFVAKLLIEKYGLPKKFLEGADKALNKKK